MAQVVAHHEQLVAAFDGTPAARPAVQHDVRAVTQATVADNTVAT
ncbi:hypothetical protein [Burkholderia cepacia]|nr:hypothetical protein [Burkholderia cepacia]